MAGMAARIAIRIAGRQPSLGCEVQTGCRSLLHSNWKGLHIVSEAGE